MMGRACLKLAIFFLILGLFTPSQGLFSQENNSSTALMNQFFSEQTLTVTNEGDGFVPGTLRTVLVQAAGIRKNNPFAVIKIVFDPNVKTSRIMKGPLRIEGGLTQIDCANRVSIDGSLFDSRYADEKEILGGILIHSSGNSIKNCKIFGFPGKTLVVSGNRNQIRENVIGISSSSKANNPYATLASNVDDHSGSNTGISLEDGASENIIESNNILGYKSEGVLFSALSGTGNRIVGNAFSENGNKGINEPDNPNKTYRVNLKSISKENDAYIVSGTLSDMAEVEFYLASPSGREGKMPITPPTLLNRGDFALSIKNKGFIPGMTRIVALATSPGRNTSEFSEAALIPTDAPRNELIQPAPLPTSAPIESSNPSIPMDSGNPNTATPSSSPGNTPVSISAPSAPAIDPFLNATSLPPPPVPQIVEAPKTGNNTPSKSGTSDSVRMESTFSIGNAP